ncbi:MAG: hypothetical protein IIW08_08710 [Clostridia bacterium]|nr:hypothetical protein [Clostridia bacterium]MBQ5771242.1 hypothetical protein [Clostridia bacterium]
MFRKILPHAAIILSAMYVVFFHIDCVNSAMAFIDNGITKALLYALCILSVVNAIIIISDDRRKQIKAYRKAQRKGAQRN